MTIIKQMFNNNIILINFGCFPDYLQLYSTSAKDTKSVNMGNDCIEYMRLRIFVLKMLMLSNI